MSTPHPKITITDINQTINECMIELKRETIELPRFMFFTVNDEKDTTDYCATMRDAAAKSKVKLPCGYGSVSYGPEYMKNVLGEDNPGFTAHHFQCNLKDAFKMASALDHRLYNEQGQLVAKQTKKQPTAKPPKR